MDDHSNKKDQFWLIEQAIEWIMFRDNNILDFHQKNMNENRTGGYSIFSSRTEKNGKHSITHRHSTQVTSNSDGIVRINDAKYNGHLLAISGAVTNPHENFNDAETLLRQQLINGNITARGSKNDIEDIRDISKDEWEYLKFYWVGQSRVIARYLDQPQFYWGKLRVDKKCTQDFFHCSGTISPKTELIQNPREIIPIVKMGKSDFFIEIMYPSILNFEKINSFTAREPELWSWISENPPSTYEITFIQSRNVLQVTGLKGMTRAAFKEAYKRTYVL